MRTQIGGSWTTTRRPESRRRRRFRTGSAYSDGLPRSGRKQTHDVVRYPARWNLGGNLIVPRSPQVRNVYRHTEGQYSEPRPPDIRNPASTALCETPFFAQYASCLHGDYDLLQTLEKIVGQIVYTVLQNLLDLPPLSHAFPITVGLFRSVKRLKIVPRFLVQSRRGYGDDQ